MGGSVAAQKSITIWRFAAIATCLLTSCGCLAGSQSPQLGTSCSYSSDLIHQLRESFSGRKSVTPITFGAKEDATSDSSCAMTVGSPILLCAGHHFKRADTGKVVTVKGAAAEGRQLTTTIVAYSKAGEVRLQDAATTTAVETTAIWGTDNLRAFQQALAAAAGKRLAIPKGNFLVRVSATAQLEVPSNILIAGEPLSAMYVVGVSGTPRGDGGTRLFHLPEGTHDVLFDGIQCIGENQPYSVVSMNQSECIGGVGLRSDSLRDIAVLNSRFENLYGFSVHDAGTGSRFHVIANYFEHTAKGLNVNSDYSILSCNQFNEDGGLEASGSYSSYDYNSFYNCSGQYTVSLGGRTSLPDGIGSESIGNVIERPTAHALGAISVANGFARGKVTDNTIFGLSSAQIGINLSHSDYPATTDGNLIAGNEITGSNASRGIIVGGGVHDTRLDRNKTAGGMYGAIIYGSGTRTQRNIWSGTFKDLSISQGHQIDIQGDVLVHGVSEILRGATVTQDSSVHVGREDSAPLPLGAKREKIDP